MGFPTGLDQRRVGTPFFSPISFALTDSTAACSLKCSVRNFSQRCGRAGIELASAASRHACRLKAAVRTMVEMHDIVVGQATHLGAKRLGDDFDELLGLELT